MRLGTLLRNKIINLNRIYAEIIYSGIQEKNVKRTHFRLYTKNILYKLEFAICIHFERCRGSFDKY